MNIFENHRVINAADLRDGEEFMWFEYNNRYVTNDNNNNKNNELTQDVR